MFRHTIAPVLCAAVALLAAPASGQTPVERGKYLAEGLASCISCHTPKEGPAAGKAYAGGEMFGGDKGPFTAYAPNITSDKETGIGAWTDEQIIAALREGKRPDGTIIGPPMPIGMYRGISDTDVKALVAYLRTIPPVSNKPPKSVYRMPLPASYGPPVGQVADVPRDDTVKYGAYLAGPIAHCIDCHTPQVQGRGDFANQLGRGGRAFGLPTGVAVARNITSHPEHGLGNWSDAEIKRAVTQGISKDGRKLGPPMEYANLAKATPEDLDAIVAYLRTIKPLEMP
jgi:mono/diheme cytochrome c family protein